MIESILVFVIIGSIFLGYQINYLFFAITILSSILLYYFYKKGKAKELRIIKERIKGQWGKEHIEDRDFSQISKLYDLLLKKDPPSFHIDDITWRDLNMNTVFSKIDHTKSLPGMQYLYNLLRNPIFEKDRLEKRNIISKSLLENDEITSELQYPLYILGKNQGKKIFNYFTEGIDMSTKPLLYLTLLSYLPFAALILFFINKQIAFVFLIGVISINSYVYQVIKKEIYSEMDTFKYLGSLIKCSKNIIKVDTNNIDLRQDELDELLKLTKKASKNITKINYNEGPISDAEILIHYYNMVFLREPKIFYQTVNSINKHQEDFKKMYKIIGEIDTHISIASYKSGLSYYTEPKFVEDSTVYYLKTDDIYHPLLDEPVPYSIELNNNGALVTGSNASGKSTFLRTLGINTIFAQTMTFALAKNYTSSYFKLLTSIGTVDSIVEGDSYFMAEAKSLLRVLNELDPNQPVFCILDEIFRGTNTAERISAASESLDYMIHKNCCVIAATHDLELTSMVDNNYDNYHFKETIDKNDINFDYILRDGPCTSRNGIAILKYLGYPKEIHEQAAKKAEEYLMG